MAYAEPGQIAVNSTVPFGAQDADQATWAAGAAFQLLNGIRTETARNGGDPTKVGMPASWPYGPIPANAVYADGSISPLLMAQVQSYTNSPAAQQDQDFNTWVGMNYSAASAGGYIDKPLTISEQLAIKNQELAVRNQELAEQKYIQSLIGSGGSSSGGGSTRTSYGSSGGSGGGGSSGTDYNARLQYEQGSADIDAQLAREKFELQKQLMLLQFELDNDPNNPKLLLEKQRLDEDVRQFNASLAQKTASEEKALQLERAKTVADYGANPGDAVAREYFLRAQGQQPLGTPVDIFTGQSPTGAPQMTLSEVMTHNAPLLKPYMQANVSGAPAPTTPPPTTPPPTTPPPVDETQPAFAFGTSPRRPSRHPLMQGSQQVPRQITPDGWTQAKQFIAGDPRVPGQVNPEQIQLRVRDGQPEAKVTPMNPMPFGAPKTQQTYPVPMPIPGGTMPDTGFHNPGNKPTPPAPSGMPVKSQGMSNASPQGISQMMARMPKFADGTTYDPYSADFSSNIGFGSPAAPTTSTFDSSFYSGATYNQNNDTGYVASPISNMPTYQIAGDNPSWGGYDVGSKYVKSDYHGNLDYAPAPTNTSGYLSVDNPPDQYYGTPYEGMSSTDLVTNQNSAYAGMSVEDALAAQLNALNSPSTTVVGPSFQQKDETGATWALPDDTRYVDNQADAGILTGAQLSTGATQSTNPGLPGYVSPFPSPQPSPYGVQQDPGLPIQKDANNDGLDDTTGTAMGVVQTANGGWTYNGTPTTQTGAALDPNATTATDPNKAPIPVDNPDLSSGKTYYMGPDGKWYENTSPTEPSPTGQGGATTPTSTATTSGSPQLSAPNASGYSTLLTGGTVKTPDGGGTYTLKPGDITMPGGGYARYDPILKTYTPIQPAYTLIDSREKWLALSPETQQAILSGKTTGYALTEKGSADQWLSSLMALHNGGQGNTELTQEQFMALQPDQQRQLLESYNSRYQPSRYFSDQVTTDSGPMAPYALGGLQLNTSQGSPGQPYDYDKYMTEGLFNSLYPRVAQQLTQPTSSLPPLGTTPPPTGTTPPPTGTTPPPTGTTPPPTGTTPPPGGTTPPPTGTTPPPGGTAPPPGGVADLLQQLLLALSYGGDVYQNLPALQFLMGNMSQGEYDTISNAPVDVPGLPVSLPGANTAANYTNLQHLQQTNPDAFALLNSLYTAGNVPLSSIMAFAKNRAPLGSAYETSLVSTT